MKKPNGSNFREIWKFENILNSVLKKCERNGEFW